MGDLILLFKGLALRGKVVDLDFLRMNLTRFLALGGGPLCHESDNMFNFRSRGRTRSCGGSAVFSGGINMV